MNEPDRQATGDAIGYKAIKIIALVEALNIAVVCIMLLALLRRRPGG